MPIEKNMRTDGRDEESIREEIHSPTRLQKKKPFVVGSFHLRQDV